MVKDEYYYAKKRVKAKKGFYQHLGVFIAVGLFFFLMNMATLNDEPEVWFIFPLLPWGIGLLIHYFSVFGLPGVGPLTKEWEEEEIEKELVRMRQFPSVLLEEELDGLELEPDKLELEEKLKRKNEYDDKDLV